MRYSLAPLALAALVAATPMPQVTSNVSPDGDVPSSCDTSYPGTFNIQIVNVSDAVSKRSIHKRQSMVLALQLEDGILTDDQGRTGYIAANSQFQFDSPPQTGAKYTAGWSVCDNGRLALGSDQEFYSCLSGDFYNLYNENVLDTDQCTPIYIDVVGGGGSGAVSVMPDGQPTGPAVTQITDGQIQATSAVAPVTQITDGQIQATSAIAPVTQISDGQIQATSAVVPVTQISDGQIQASGAVSPVTQISDGQIQAPTGSPIAPVTQISDGQIQAPSALPTGYVSQISDGQIQAPTNGSMVYPSVPVQTGNGASALQMSGAGVLAAVFGAAML